MNVTLGAHNIKQQERTQQVIGVRRAICHPDYNPKNFSNDIMLLKVNRPASHALPGSACFRPRTLLPLSPPIPGHLTSPCRLRTEKRHISCHYCHAQAQGPLAEPTLVSSHQLERKSQADISCEAP